jgi:hypothetical protein
VFVQPNNNILTFAYLHDYFLYSLDRPNVSMVCYFSSTKIGLIGTEKWQQGEHLAMAVKSRGNSYSSGEHPDEGALLVQQPKKRGRPRKVVAVTVDETLQPDTDYLPPKRRGSPAARRVTPDEQEIIARVKAPIPGQRRPPVEIRSDLRDLGLTDPDDKTKPQARVSISPPKFELARVTIEGTTPLVLHKFSQKVQNTIRATQEAGSQSRKGKTRQARDFDENYENARHRAIEGWDGIPASAFRNALISACRTVGFKMTIAKMSLFVMADGFDEQGTGLVRITKGEPRCDIRPGRNANGGIDLRARPMFADGWQAQLILKWDGDQFSANDVVNLLARAGQQVGVGEGRPDSKMSAGCGWGEFKVLKY